MGRMGKGEKRIRSGTGLAHRPAVFTIQGLPRPGKEICLQGSKWLFVAFPCESRVYLESGRLLGLARFVGILVQQNQQRPPAQPPGQLPFSLALDVVSDAEQQAQPALLGKHVGPAFHRIALDEWQAAPDAPPGIFPAPLSDAGQQRRRRFVIEHLAGGDALGDKLPDQGHRISSTIWISWV